MTRPQPEAGSEQTDGGRDNPDVIYNGSLLLPVRGRLCRQTAFDNRNGRMIDRGLVDCSQPAVQAAGQGAQGIEYARLRAIGNAFNRQDQ